MYFQDPKYIWVNTSVLEALFWKWCQLRHEPHFTGKDGTRPIARRLDEQHSTNAFAGAKIQREEYCRSPLQSRWKARVRCALGELGGRAILARRNDAEGGHPRYSRGIRPHLWIQLETSLPFSISPYSSMLGSSSFWGSFTLWVKCKQAAIDLLTPERCSWLLQPRLTKPHPPKSYKSGACESCQGWHKSCNNYMNCSLCREKSELCRTPEDSQLLPTSEYELGATHSLEEFSKKILIRKWDFARALG